MSVLKFVIGVILFLALVALVQLPEIPMDSPSAQFQRLPAVPGLPAAAAGNTFENLAGNTVADSALFGQLAPQADPEFAAALDRIRPMTAVFAPADGAITLAKAAQRPAINASLLKHLSQTLLIIESEPRSPLAVEKFKDNFMPIFELAKRCRSWDQFATILRQADSPDQLKVLTKIASASPDAASQLSAVLKVAGAESHACLDFIMRQGPRGLDALHAALHKGAPGLKFVIEHPGMTPLPAAKLSPMQEKYQTLRQQYGPGISALKYLAIAILCALLVLVAVPGRYLEKLVTRPGSPVPAPGAIHYFLSALAVGVVIAGLAYLLSLAVRPGVESPASAATGGTSPATMAQTDNAFLSGTVVLLSLAIHAVVWFFVRGKIRQVEDDENSSPTLRLKRLENLDVFLDLPLFTGLALTVCAFILITLNAGMSRHFAYSATVVGILSAVSLRIRYQYPLKERLTQQAHT